MDRNRALGIIEGILSPFIGAHMARASTQVQCRKLSISSDQITPEQARAMIDGLSKGLIVFVGRDKTEELVRKMESGLALKGGR